ncbi:Hypothetical predicted protein [Olea europaea subsp. europaea]|uniref:DUF632 domain-containing protein n=1 Tax=Olea europaea subsp. europaea TaxID=158383 RepID=A0A8S0RG83_OLEEU|nr:Hypothetical predicted protein [Olea europaea subsp. europaea]
MANEVEKERVLNDDERCRVNASIEMERDPMKCLWWIGMWLMMRTSQKNRSNLAGFKARGGFKVDSEVVKEIQVQFERASKSGSELSELLEFGKLPYKNKRGGCNGKYLILFPLQYF